MECFEAWLEAGELSLASGQAVVVDIVGEKGAELQEREKEREREREKG